MSLCSVSQELSSEFDARFNRWEWRLQRVGWVVIALAMVLAVAGLFGGGFLSQATARHQGEGYEIVLEYPRFGRAESNLAMDLEVIAPGREASQVEARLSGEFVEKTTITAISPEPESQSVDGDAIVFTWEVEDWSEPLVVRFEYEGRDWRVISGRFDLAAGDDSLGSLTFDQFLFP